MAPAESAPLWILLLTAALLAAGASTVFGETLDSGDRDLAKELVLAAPEHYYPYSEVGPDGKLGGFSVELTNAVARVMNLNVRWKAVPNSDLADALSKGDVDAVSFIADTVLREKHFDFSVPVVELEEGIVIRADDGRIHRLQDLQGRRIAVGPKTSHGERIVNYFLQGSTPVYTEKWEESLQLVQSSQCDGAIMTKFRALALIDRFGMKDLKLMDAKLTGYTFRCGFAVRKGDSELLARYNEGLVMLHSSGEFDRIYEKWFGRYEKTKITEKQILMLLASVLAFGFVVSSVAFLHQRNLSRRIAAQSEELNEQRALLSTLFDNNPLATVVMDLVPGENPRIITLNREACRLFALDPAKASARTLDSLGLSPEFMRIVTDLLDRYRASGDQFAWEVNLSGARLYLEASIIGIGTASAGRQRVCILIADITRRRMIDNEVTQARRVHALGELVGGIAHEFNNLLTPILATANMLKEENRENAELTNDLALIEQASVRAADLTRRLLTFGRRSVEQTLSVRLSDVVSNCFALIHTTTDRRIVLKSEVPADLPLIEANPTDLNQVLFNLIINARDALVEKLSHSLDSSWNPQLVVRAEELAADQVAGVPGTSREEPQGWVKITVEDNGAGIAPEVIDRIFDPFFSTKSVGKGTGLGLATVWHLVTGAGGTVRAESEPGRAARFVVILRRAKDREEAPSAPASAKHELTTSAAGRAALLVEDEPLVAQTAVSMLEKLGCRVAVARDGGSGLKAFRANPGAYWLLMVDLNMPKMSGIEFVRRIRATPFAGKIIVISGNVSDSEADTLRNLGVDRILSKPFTLAQLSEALDSAEVKMG